VYLTDNQIEIPRGILTRHKEISQTGQIVNSFIALRWNLPFLDVDTQAGQGHGNPDPSTSTQPDPNQPRRQSFSPILRLLQLVPQ
jgi:hypothetical protein